MTISTIKETPRSDGGKVVEYFNAAKERHREDGPACIRYYASGVVEREEFCVNDILHREDGPAYIRYYANGQVEVEGFYVDGERHLENGPSWVGYYANGKLKFKGFWVNNVIHKEDDPAWIDYDDKSQISDEEFYIDGVELSAEGFLHETYIDKLPNQVLREQAEQLAAGSDCKVTTEQLNKAVGLTLKENPVVKLTSQIKINNVPAKNLDR